MNFKKQKLYLFTQFLILFNTVLVGTGYLTGIHFLKSYFTEFPGQRLTTMIGFFPVCFFLLYEFYKPSTSDLKVAFYATTLFVCSLLLFCINLKPENHFGIENLFYQTDKADPSQMGLLCFASIGLSSLFFVFKRFLFLRRFLAICVIANGIAAMLGFLTSQPLLYSEIENFSYAMSFPTALLFIFSGFTLYQKIKIDNGQIVHTTIDTSRLVSQNLTGTIEKGKDVLLSF